MANVLQFCRICLSVNVRMFTLENSNLEHLYKLLTHVYVSVDDGKGREKATLVCFMCHARLRQCNRLQQQAIKSNNLLNQLLRGGFMQATPGDIVKNLFSGGGLQVTSVHHINLEPTCEDLLDAKVETIVSSVEKGKKPIDNGHDVTDFPHDANDSNDFAAEANQSDPEDDLPLIAIGSYKADGFKENGGEKKRRKRQEKDLVVEAKEIELTLEEQKNELLARANSENYINSPYKCDNCYKGFIHLQAFNNHMVKHDLASGTHECRICLLRYSSARQRKAHESSAHARRYACPRCPHRSHTKHQARDHEKWHNGHTYPCKICGQKFQKPTSYLTHLRKHHSEHACTLCGESFVGRHGLLMHRSKAHKKSDVEQSEEEPSQRFCGECNIQFLTRDAWKRHVLTSYKHTAKNESSWGCPVCPERVSPSRRAAHLRSHMRDLRPKPETPNITPALTLPCSQCDAQFASRSRLRAHVRRVHLGLKYDRSLVCEVCGKKCTSTAALLGHQRRHTGERPFACTQCGRRFAERARLRVHARTHSGERPYACLACPRRFAQKPALNRHYRVHSGARPYSCAQCSKCFSQSNSLKLHVHSVHLKLPHPARQKRDANE